MQGSINDRFIVDPIFQGEKVKKKKEQNKNRGSILHKISRGSARLI